MDYKTIEACFELSGVESIATSELHGFIAGGLCAQGSHFSFDERLFEGFIGDNQALSEAVDQLIQFTQEQLNQPNSVPNLLLPDDNSMMLLRCRCLTEWCQGFLYALGVSGLTDKQLRSGDSGEVIKDIIKISHAYREEHDAEEALEPNEEDEKTYTEIVEYLRAGLMILNDSLRPALQSDPTTLH